MSNCPGCILCDDCSAERDRLLRELETYKRTARYWYVTYWLEAKDCEPPPPYSSNPAEDQALRDAIDLAAENKRLREALDDIECSYNINEAADGIDITPGHARCIDIARNALNPPEPKGGE